jgi:hypothetical protein
MKGIYVTTNGKMSVINIATDELINQYELYAPVCKYPISIGVKPIENLNKREQKINKIGTDIYQGEMMGNIVIVSDNEDDIDVYFKELVEAYTSVK